MTWLVTHQMNGKSSWARLVRGQVRAALRHPLERSIGQRERTPVLVLEDNGVEGSAAGVAGADSD